MATSPKRPLVRIQRFFFWTARRFPKMDPKTEMALRKHLKLPFMAELGRSSRDITPATYRDWSAKTVAACRELYDRVEKESARDMTADEKLAFDEGMRLVDYWKTALGEKEARRGGRHVSPEQVWGVESERGSIRGVDPELRYVTDEGREIRALRPSESIREAFSADLPDGIQPGELSLGRYIRAAILGDFSKARAEQRAMAGNSDVGGGVLVPAILSADVIDLARNQAVSFQAGAQTIPMDSSTLAIAKLTADAAMQWHVENQPQTLQQNTFGRVTLSAKTLVGLVSASIEIVEDGRNFSQIIENALGKALAVEIDRASLRGDGTGGSPVGIRNQLGVQLIDLGTNGATLTSTTFYPQWSNAVKLIKQKNLVARSTIFAPRTASGQDLLINTLNDALDPPDSWKNLEKFVTNQLPITNTKGSSNSSSEAYVGDWTKMLIGSRTDLTLEISRVAGDSSGSAFRNLQVWIRIYWRGDVQLARPENFVLI